MTEVSFTVGKLDASIALLLTADHHLIEFPTILLPNGIKPGSFVTIKANQDSEKEETEKKKFEDLQDRILQMYGTEEPEAPIFKVKNITQTSAVLEWDPIKLGSAQIKSLTLYKNGLKLGKIPNPLGISNTKLSGLQLNTTYVFKLRLDTTAGIFYSNDLSITTHKMTDLSGITVCIGDVQAHEGIDMEDIVSTLHEMGAKPLQSEVGIDTTHFIATAGNGIQWKKALDSNIPIVRPEWLRACALERRIIGVRNFYLDCDPSSLKDFKFIKKVVDQQQPNDNQEPLAGPAGEIAEPIAPASANVSETLNEDQVATPEPLAEDQLEVTDGITQEVTTEDVTIGNSTGITDDLVKEQSKSQGEETPEVIILTDPQEETGTQADIEAKMEISQDTVDSNANEQEVEDFEDVELNKEGNVPEQELSEVAPPVEETTFNNEVLNSTEEPAVVDDTTVTVEEEEPLNTEKPILNQETPTLQEAVIVDSVTTGVSEGIDIKQSTAEENREEKEDSDSSESVDVTPSSIATKSPSKKKNKKKKNKGGKK